MTGAMPAKTGIEIRPGRQADTPDVVSLSKRTLRVCYTPFCQGRSKIRPRWRRNTRPSGSGSELLKVASRGEASGSRGGSVVAGFLAVFEAITVAVQLQDVDVMGQPVE